MIRVEFRIGIRIFLFLGLAGVVFWLLWMAVVPNGEIEYYTDFGDDNFFIRKFSPEERVEKRNKEIKLIANPVYFNLRTPRTFDQAELSLKYQNKSESVVEVGPLVDKDLWRYRLTPVENKILEQIDIVWPRIEGEDVSLWQRPGLDASSSYVSLEQFWENPPGVESIAIYNYDVSFNYTIKGYESSDSALIWPYALRGDWQSFIYIDNEDLSVSVDIVDLNQNLDLDSGELRLYCENELLFKESFVDDGNILDDGKVSSVKSIILRQAGLPTGVYKLEFRAGSDLVTKKIESEQEKFVFNSNINFHKDGNVNFNIWTDSSKVQAVTIYPESLQTLGLGKNEMEISEVYAQASAKVLKASSSDEISFINIKKDGLEISGAGTFAINKDAWFNPKLKKINSDLDINKSSVNYILAKYQSLVSQADWRIANVKIDLKDAYREGGQYSFLISVPNIKSGRELIIKEIDIKLKGRTLLQKIKEYIDA